MAYWLPEDPKTGDAALFKVRHEEDGDLQDLWAGELNAGFELLAEEERAETEDKSEDVEDED